MTKHDNSKPMGCSKSSSKREVYSNIILPQEIRKIRAEINKIETKKTIAKSNETKSGALRR